VDYVNPVKQQKTADLAEPTPWPGSNPNKANPLPRPYRWTVVGLYEPGKYSRDVFITYCACDTAQEAREFAERSNAALGDKVTILACVVGGGVATVFDDRLSGAEKP
jgi:hypothetical protein